MVSLTLNLYGRSGKGQIRVHGDYVRKSCAAEGQGLTFFLVTDHLLPTIHNELELYRSAISVEYKPQETILHYDLPGPITKVVFITREADDRFRQESPQIVSNAELFREDF